MIALTSRCTECRGLIWPWQRSTMLAGWWFHRHCFRSTTLAQALRPPR